VAQSSPILGDIDLHLLAEGTHRRAYEKLGAHPCERDGVAGTAFGVWAPNANWVRVVGDFNEWNGKEAAMNRVGVGFWELFIPGAAKGHRYKFKIEGPGGKRLPLKSDPFGFHMEYPPHTGSIIHGLPEFQWTDEAWMKGRVRCNRHDGPLAIYEVHLGSWMRAEGGRFMTYQELAQRLVPYVVESGFTHLQLLPIMEHPYYGSWGYQPLGLFAPTTRHGSPEDFAALVDAAHRAGLGVILDWVPAHFPEDAHGLAHFDGTCLYEHEDPKQGRHQDWGTLIYNFDRPEVRNFLTASALFWLDRFHVDGLRVDAVASMLYLDYSRKEGEWVPNRFGGRENLEAVAFLRHLNDTVHTEFPDTFTYAEESTTWPLVSSPTHNGGLGFDFKWNMGWMNDTLKYFQRPMQYRRWHQDELTFSMTYHTSEKFVLPFSHDEVVHGKGSLLRKMPGTLWEQFANLRLLLAWMYAHGGKKLLFMGAELAPDLEWNHMKGLDWNLVKSPPHLGVQSLVRELNRLHQTHPALHELDSEYHGFKWIDCGDRDNSVLAVLRQGKENQPPIVVMLNFTARPHEIYGVGVPLAGRWKELLNTDSERYGGSNVAGLRSHETLTKGLHGQPCSLELSLPPLGALFLTPEQA
jgi:1,4-alpha-glucan branching enzyme